MNMEKPKKIIIIGLDNGGKTSIVRFLSGKNEMDAFFEMSPTKGFAKETIKDFGSEFLIWDFGGQEAYRNDHLQKFNKYLEGVSKVIYVIDIQAMERYDLALEYMKDIVGILVEEYPILDFSVFLHKFDPNIQKQKPELTDEVINDLVNKINLILPRSYYTQIFKTSLYITFDKIIIG